MASRACIGTSGWNYESWRDDFYRGIPQKNWLGFSVEGFVSILSSAKYCAVKKR